MPVSEPSTPPNPAGVCRESGRIRRMFADISPRYDLLNHLLSLNLDRGWRRAAARALGARPGERVLDLCTGTGDLAFEVSRTLGRRGAGAEGLVIGADFTRPMLSIAAGKASRSPGGAPVRFAAADALALPFDDGAFDGVTAAFGVR